MNFFIVFMFAIVFYSGCVFSLQPFDFKNGNFFSGSKLIKQSMDCFSKDLRNYDAWLSYLKSNTKYEKHISKVSNREVFENRAKNLDCQIFTYLVDGIEVEGIMVQPKGKTLLTSTMPVLVYNRGGNNGKVGLDQWDMFKIYYLLMPWAEEGYFVIASNYRGADNFPDSVRGKRARDEFGGSDVKDVIALYDVIQKTPGLDVNKIAIYGASRGSLMAYKAAIGMPNIKSLIIKAGWSDLKEDLKVRPGMEKLYRNMIPNYENDKDNALKQRSVKFFLDDIPKSIPILLLHGDADERVNVSNATDIHKSMIEKGYKSKLVIYENGNHSLRNYENEVNFEISQWLKTSLN